MHYGSLERKIGGGQDSTVWQRRGSVVKFYRRLNVEAVYRYHRLQSRVSELVKTQLDNTLQLPKDLSWGNQRVSTISLDVLRLPEAGVYHTFDEVLGEPPERSQKRCPERLHYESISVVEYVSGHRLTHSACDDIGALLGAIEGHFEAFGLDMRDNAPDPVNIKASFQEGTLSLVVTDVLSSVERGLGNMDSRGA